jgi:hypothetical protein
MRAPPSRLRGPGWPGAGGGVPGTSGGRWTLIIHTAPGVTPNRTEGVHEKGARRRRDFRETIAADNPDCAVITTAPSRGIPLVTPVSTRCRSIATPGRGAVGDHAKTVDHCRYRVLGQVWQRGPIGADVLTQRFRGHARSWRCHGTRSGMRDIAPRSHQRFSAENKVDSQIFQSNPTQLAATKGFECD